MKRLIHFVFILVATIAFSACNHAKVYDEYAHTPIAGWEKNDTLSFEIPPMAATGYYRQTIYPANKGKRIEKTDTLLCQLINQHGENKGQGISYYQYNFPINIYKINRGDSIHIAIRHDMKREILPGVSDIGVKITKNDQ